MGTDSLDGGHADSTLSLPVCGLPAGRCVNAQTWLTPGVADWGPERVVEVKENGFEL